MHRPRIIQVIALLTCVALLFGASRLIAPINETRSNLNILGSKSDLKNAPPEYAFAIQAFGAFRSIIVNIAFIRAEDYKNQGRYYDAMQLAEWICNLQPHFPAVWEFQSWNMAWNISVTTFTPQERWQWVYNGVKLIRDRGLDYNPRAVNLYKQVAWIFNNKMGADVDEFHRAYKLNWAWRMHLLLGPPAPPPAHYDPDELMKKIAFDLHSDPLYQAARIQGEQFEEAWRKQELARGHEVAPRDPNEPEKTAEDFEIVMDASPATKLAHAAAIEFIEAIADSPDTLAELYDRVPETEKMVSELWKLGARITDDELTEEAYEQLDGLAFTFFSRYRRLADPTLRSKLTLPDENADPEDLSEDQRAQARFDEIVGVRERRPAGVALVRFLQKKVLREVYNNDPAHLVRLVRQFGPMDWRLVDSQSLYWATQAVVAAEGVESKFGNDKTNTARIMLFSLQNMARRNKLFYDPHPDLFKGNLSDPIYESYLNYTPDPSFIESMHQAYLKYAPEFDPQRRGDAGVGSLFSGGHINFLKEGIRTLWLSGRTEAAAKYYEYLRRVYGHHPDGRIREQYLKPLRDFVVDDYHQSVGREVDAKRMIAGLMRWSFESAASGDQVKAANLIRQAHEVHKSFNEMKERVTIKRHQLPPFMEMYADEFVLHMMQRSFNDLSTIHKSRVWAAAPVFLQQRAYDRVLASLQTECEAFGLDVEKAFPEPPGMAEFRERNPSRSRELEEDDDSVTPVQPIDPGG